MALTPHASSAARAPTPGPSGACSGYLVAVRHHERVARLRPGHARPRCSSTSRWPTSTRSSSATSTPTTASSCRCCATPSSTGSASRAAGDHDRRRPRRSMDGITPGRGADLRLGGGRPTATPPRSATSASPSPAPTTRSRRWRCGSSTPAGSLVYSADTGPGLVASAASGRRCDLALCEATLPRGRGGRCQHLTGAEAGALAREAGAERLLLTHLVPGTDPARRRSEAEATYEGPVSWPRPATPTRSECAPTAATRRSCARSPSSATSPTPPPGSVLVSLRPDQGAVHGVGRRRRAPLDAGQGQGLGHRRVLDAAGLVGRADPAGGEGRASRPGAPRRSSASSAGRCGPCATWRRSASGRSSSTATCSRPTAAPAPRRSAAATSRCTTR